MSRVVRWEEGPPAVYAYSVTTEVDSNATTPPSIAFPEPPPSSFEIPEQVEQSESSASSSSSSSGISGVHPATLPSATLVESPSSSDERFPPLSRPYHHGPRSTTHATVLTTGRPFYPPSMWSSTPFMSGASSTLHQHIPYLDPSYDYESKYPPDPDGQEMEPSARVWKVYRDETEVYDHDMIRGFRETIESMLVFAALFSAVVTTFVVETVQNLQPDYTKFTTFLLIEQNLLLRANGNDSLINAVPRTSTAEMDVVESVDLWYNALFFASLSLALITATLCVLTKQWFHAYDSTASGDTMEKALVRQFRFTGLVKWKVPQVVALLPVLLNLSLMIFLIGLSIFVYTLSEQLSLAIIIPGGGFLMFYFVSAAMPILWVQCPYRTPAFQYTLHLLTFVPYVFWHYASWLTLWIRGIEKERPKPMNRNSKSVIPTIHSIEQNLLHRGSDYFNFYSPLQQQVMASSFGWMFQVSSNPSVKRIIIGAVGSFLSALRLRKITLSEEILSQLPLQSMVQATCDTLFRIPSPPEPSLLRFLQSVVEIFGQSPSSPDLFPRDMLEKAWEADQVDFLNFCLDQDFSAIPFPEAFLQSRLEYYVSMAPAGSLAVDLNIDGPILQNLSNTDAALYTTAYHGDLGTAAVLLRRGASVQYKNLGEESTPLHAAAWNGHLSVVELLLDYGADPNAADTRGNLPLHLACSRMNVEVAKLLAECTPPNVLNQGGHTFILSALYYSTHQNESVDRFLDLAEVLVAQGADINALDGQQQTALTYAISYFGEDHPVPEFFRRHGGILPTRSNSPAPWLSITPASISVTPSVSYDEVEPGPMELVEDGGKEDSPDVAGSPNHHGSPTEA